MKTIFFFIVLMFFLTLVSAQVPVLKLNETINNNQTLKSGAPAVIMKNPGNMSYMNVNNSLCWLGHCTEASLLHSSLGNLAWSVAGHTIDANIDMNGYTFTNSDVLLNNTDGGYNISINSQLPITTTSILNKFGAINITDGTDMKAFIDADGQMETDYGLDFDTVGLPPKLTATLVAEAGNVDAGVHYYYVTQYTAIGETASTHPWPQEPITTTAGSGKVDLTNIPVSTDYRVIGRRIYRTKADESYWKTYSLVDIPNNVDTTYQDNVADADLTGFVNEGYFRIDTTNKIITIDGVSSMIIAEGATSLGYNTGYGGSCTVFGAYAGENMDPSTTTNSLFGDYAGNDITSGTANSFFGQVSGARVTIGSYNNAVGRNALGSIAGSNNIAFGYGAGYGTTGAGNVFIGHKSGWADATVNAGKADYNTAVGYQTGFLLTSGDYNILFGHETGNNIITGSYNLLIGNDVYASASDATYELNIGDVIKGNLTSGNVNVSGNITAENVFLPSFIFTHTNNTIPVAVAGNWYNVTFDEEVADPKKRITHTYNDNTNDTFTIVDDGYYNIHYAMSFSSAQATPTSHVIMRVIKNGAEIEGSLLEEDATKQYADFTISNGPISYLVAGDKITFQFTSDDTDVSLTSHRTYGDHHDTAVVKIIKTSN